MVVFDMAGTTVDEQNVVYKTLKDAINEHCGDVSLDKVLRIGAGKEKLQAIKDVLLDEGTTDINAEEVFESFKLTLDKAYEDLDVKPIVGVEELLIDLRAKGVTVVLNTGYNRKVATSLLQKLYWIEGTHFDLLLTADDVKNGRPHPDMIQLAMQKFGISDPAEVLKAGDSVIDIQEGKNAACGVTIGVLSGAQNHEQLSGVNATYILNSLAELPEVVEF